MKMEVLITRKMYVNKMTKQVFKMKTKYENILTYKKYTCEIPNMITYA